jgi:CBS domain-containing membrane protein
MDEEKDTDPTAEHSDPDALPSLELSDQDILDAMRRIPGYIDITTEDFRALYHLAHAHALRRLFGAVRAARLMRAGIEPLEPEMPLDEAAGSLARQGLKGLPVVDADRRVVGILTETDFLRRLHADTFVELLLRLMEDTAGFTHRCHETQVRAAMTTPAVTVPEGAGFADIVAAFHNHEGRGMPVVDNAGRLRGLLLRKDFLAAFHLEDLL